MASAQRVLATQATFDTFSAFTPGNILVGRMVANLSFMKALARYSSFDQFCFLVGEHADVERLTTSFIESGILKPERVRFANLLALPALLAQGEISVLHQNDFGARYFDLVHVRNRYAMRTVPATGQIHTLSYANMMSEYLKGVLIGTRPGDAVFCSSLPGRDVVRKHLAALHEQLSARGLEDGEVPIEMPHVPLGVDAAALAGGDRAKGRALLGIPRDAIVVFGMARFTEYDKMDLFPLLLAFQRVVARMPATSPPVHLALAGARQGTKTPEMLQAYAKALKIQDRVHLRIDFEESEKRDLLAASDVFVSPVDNVQETFGISVVEAMAAGLPLVVSDFDGYKDTVTPDVGVRIKTRWGADLSELSELAPLLYERPMHLILGQNVEVDLRHLVQTLVELCQDAPRRQRLGAAARQRALSHYDWSKVVAQYEAHWSELAGRPWSGGSDTGHPLTVRYNDVFSRYPTEEVSPDRMVVASERGRTLCSERNLYPIYPELTQLISGDEVVFATRAAGDAVSVEILMSALHHQFQGRPLWQPAFLVTWMLKHGLLEDGV